MARARGLHGGDGWLQPLRLRRQVAPAGEVDDQPEEHAHARRAETVVPAVELAERAAHQRREQAADVQADVVDVVGAAAARIIGGVEVVDLARQAGQVQPVRSEEHTSALKSLMRISYAVLCLKKQKKVHL